MDTTPGLVRPEWLGISWPSIYSWLLIFIGLTMLVLLIQLAVWGYYVAVGDDQYEDLQTRERMNLGSRVSVFGSRMRPALERLAEPQRSRALKIYLVLNVTLGVVMAAGALTMAIYWTITAPA